MVLNLYIIPYQFGHVKGVKPGIIGTMDKGRRMALRPGVRLYSKSSSS